MNKAVTIALLAVLFLCLGLGIFGMRFIQKRQQTEISLFVGSIEDLVAGFRKANPAAKIEPTNGAWAMALISGPGGVEISQLLVDGQFVDSYGHPLKFEEGTDDAIKVTSAGKDGERGTSDDVDSAAYRALADGRSHEGEESP